MTIDADSINYFYTSRGIYLSRTISLNHIYKYDQYDLTLFAHFYNYIYYLLVSDFNLIKRYN